MLPRHAAIIGKRPGWYPTGVRDGHLPQGALKSSRPGKEHANTRTAARIFKALR
jgi:hypothetical protein